MSVMLDLTGKVFGRLTVLSRAEKTKPSDRIKWNCVCTCGNLRIVYGCHLPNGHTKSCGCLDKEVARDRMTTHGERYAVEYKSWASMKQRCTNVKNPFYKGYGGRGITICDRWLNSFENFIEDMGIKPDGYTIDRIDNNLGYYKDNCKWSNKTEQAINRRSTRFIEHNGVTKTLSEWARGIGMSACSLHRRLKSLPIGDALSLPKRKW